MGTLLGRRCETCPKTILENWSVQATKESQLSSIQAFTPWVPWFYEHSSHRRLSMVAQREVIDGQQRVTTLQLLLDAIQWICEESDQTDISRRAARRLAKLVTNDEELIGDDRLHIFKLWPTRGDREAFRHAMDNGLAVNDFEESVIVQAHEFFQLQIRRVASRRRRAN